jgi:hypothetical protein
MILFPYASNVEYNEGELSFSLQFFNNQKNTEIAINMSLDEGLCNLISDLLNEKEEV